MKINRGIFVLPQRAYLSIQEPVMQLADERNNTTYYTLKRFLELAATANPNIIEMLFMPSDCRIFEAPPMQRIIESRNLFITKQAYSSHINYAVAQIKRAKGHNKWVNHPQPEKRPAENDFCWFIPRQKETAAEKAVIDVPKFLADWVKSTCERLPQDAAKFPRREKNNWEPLHKLMNDVVFGKY